MASRVPRTCLAEYKAEGDRWITLANGEYYPDILVDACLLYEPVLVMFGQLLKSSESSERLLLQLTDVPNPWMRVQLARVFHRYVSPATPVEMLKRKAKIHEVCRQFGEGFRPIQDVQSAFVARPMPDEPLCAVLWEYKDRGKKGYDLTERFFSIFRSCFPELPILGPERAGRDIRLGEIWVDYPNPKRPVGFIVYDGGDRQNVLAVGLVRYDSDRGGAQEDDRVRVYQNCADEVLGYAQQLSHLRYLETATLGIATNGRFR